MMRDVIYENTFSIFNFNLLKIACKYLFLSPLAFWNSRFVAAELFQYCHFTDET